MNVEKHLAGLITFLLASWHKISLKDLRKLINMIFNRILRKIDIITNYNLLFLEKIENE